MKISKKQLRQIIKEELTNESSLSGHPLEGVAASAGSIARGLVSGKLSAEGASERLESEVIYALYDFIKQEKAMGGL